MDKNTPSGISELITRLRHDRTLTDPEFAALIEYKDELPALTATRSFFAALSNSPTSAKTTATIAAFAAATRRSSAIGFPARTSSPAATPATHSDTAPSSFRGARIRIFQPTGFAAFLTGSAQNILTA